MIKTITVQLKIEGLHCRPTCPIKEVNYLKDLHRHIFHFRCWKIVSHNDRDIEIIQLKHDVQDYMHSKYYSTHNRCLLLDSMSCESIAEELINEFNLVACEVLEDGENGAHLIKEIDSVTAIQHTTTNMIVS